MRWIKGNKTRNGVKWWLVSDAPESGERREGGKWKDLDDAEGVAMVMPLTDGAPFCIIGDASGFQHDTTRLKELTDLSNGGTDWGTIGWNHWPIGWLNSRQAKLGESGVDEKTLPIYPTNFSTSAIDLFALPPNVAEQGVYYSLMGVGNNKDMEAIRTVARKWLENGTAAIIKHEGVAGLPAPIKPAASAAHPDLKQKSAK